MGLFNIVGWEFLQPLAVILMALSFNTDKASNSHGSGFGMPLGLITMG